MKNTLLAAAAALSLVGWIEPADAQDLPGEARSACETVERLSEGRQRSVDCEALLKGHFAKQPMLGGDQRAACETIMCLSEPRNRPHECDGPLRRYFSIQAKKAAARANARRAFLDQCPLQGNHNIDTMGVANANNGDPLPKDDDGGGSGNGGGQQPGSGKAALLAQRAQLIAELGSVNEQLVAAHAAYMDCMGWSANCNAELARREQLSNQMSVLQARLAEIDSQLARMP